MSGVFSRVIRIVRLLFRTLCLLSRILGPMTRILSVRVQLLGLMTRILCLLRRSGRRSRWSQCCNAVRGWRGDSRNRGFPRGSRQRGGIPWLDGLLHDGTHHLAQPTSQPADFYLRRERPCLLLYLHFLSNFSPLFSSPSPLFPSSVSSATVNAIAYFLLREKTVKNVVRPTAIDKPTSPPRNIVQSAHTLFSIVSLVVSFAKTSLLELLVTRENVVAAWRRCRSTCKMASDRCLTALRLSEGGSIG